jgi:hypothetical protein
VFPKQRLKRGRSRRPSNFSIALIETFFPIGPGFAE